MSVFPKRIGEHILYFSGGTLAGVVFAWAIGTTRPVQAVSLLTAYASYMLMAAALLIGPLRVLTGDRHRLSIRVRRNLGIWAGLFAIIHVIAGLNVHFKGRFWQYFFFPDRHGFFLALRYDFFGFTNYVGLIAILITVVLLALSNDSSIRRLGPHKWKTLQRLSYPLFGLLIVHGFIYQALEHRHVYFSTFLVAVFLVVVAFQCRGFLKRRSSSA